MENMQIRDTLTKLSATFITSILFPISAFATGTVEGVTSEDTSGNALTRALAEKGISGGRVTCAVIGCIVVLILIVLIMAYMAKESKDSENKQ